jgi:hypothetical protein
MSKPERPEKDVVHVRVPFSVRKRGGRKLIVVPAGAAPAPVRQRVDNAMVKALARAFRWRKLLETGDYATIEELAAGEKINSSYVSRVLRMTLLAPNIVENILAGRQPNELTLAVLMRSLPLKWSEQLRVEFSSTSASTTTNGEYDDG